MTGEKKIVRRRVEPEAEPSQRADAPVPDPEASLAELIAFVQLADPWHSFQREWGAEYSRRLKALWTGTMEDFREGRPTDLPSDKLLLCMGYAVTMAPYGVIPDPQLEDYLRTMLKEYRRVSHLRG